MTIKNFKHFGGLLALSLALTACNMQGAAASGQAANAACEAGKKLGQSEAGLDLVELCIISGAKTRRYTVEYAGTPREQAQGLIFRTSLADDAGMIFPYKQPQVMNFWMKNTVIPLDIIFIRADGTIESIAENTVPYSEESISSNEAVQAVLELRGGLTSELGVKAGDIVRW